MLVLLLAATDCARRPPETVPAPPAPPASDPLAGSVGVEYLADPDVVRPKLREGEWFAAPVAIRTPLPQYPAEALGRHPDPVIVSVRIIVEEDGAVREISASPLARAEDGEPPEAFRAAIERAVGEWFFAPARLHAFEGKDRAETRLLRSYLDLRFVFTIMNGAGTVTLAPE